MELSRDPAPLGLLGFEDRVHRFARDALREMNGKGGAGTECFGEANVVVGEAGVGPGLVEGGDDPDRPLVEDERDQERRHAADSACQDLIDLGICEQRVDALALPASENPRMLRLGRHGVTDHIREILAVGDDHAKPSRGGGKRDEHCAGTDQLAQAAGDELEQAGEIPLLEDAACELVENLELPDPVGCALVDLHLLDRDAGLGRKQRHDLLVCLGELAAVLLGQVEISVHDSAHEDRHTEKAPHLRMPRRKAEEVPLLRHVRNAYRARLTEQNPENAVVARQLADPSSRRLVDPGRDEALEVCPGAVEDPERGIARTDKPRRDLCGLLQNVLERGLGADRDTRRGKLSKAGFSVGIDGHG